MSFEQEKKCIKEIFIFALMENVGKIEDRVNIVHSSGRFHKEGLYFFQYANNFGAGSYFILPIFIVDMPLPR